MIEEILREIDEINAKINSLPIDRDTKSEIMGYLKRINNLLFNSIFP